MGSGFDIPSETQAVIDGICGFVEQEVIPLTKEIEDPRAVYDERGWYSPRVVALKKQVRMRSAEAGYYQMFAPREIGGGGLGPRTALLVYYELARRFGALIYPSPFRMEIIANFVNGPNAMHLFMSPSYKETVLPRLARGEIASCFALTEPDAGSDVWMLQTRAVEKDDHWVINGRKQWITNGPHADYAQLFAITDEKLFKERKGGVSCFFVDTKSPGYHVESISKIWGHSGSDEAILHFENLRVPKEALVGEVNEGFRLMMMGISLGRMMNAGQCIGLGEWAWRQALDYAQKRVTFGKRLCDHQAIQWMLADSATEIYAAKSLALRAAAKAEEMRSRLGYLAIPVKEVAMAKSYCIETSERVIDRAIQIHGGMGFCNELKLTNAFEMVRSLRVPDGSSEMQRRTIANRILQGDTDL